MIFSQHEFFHGLQLQNLVAGKAFSSRHNEWTGFSLSTIKAGFQSPKYERNAPIFRA